MTTQTLRPNFADQPQLNLTARGEEPGVAMSKTRWYRLKRDLRGAKHAVNGWLIALTVSLAVFSATAQPAYQKLLSREGDPGLLPFWTCAVSAILSAGFFVATCLNWKFQSRSIEAVIEEMEEIEAQYEHT